MNTLALTLNKVCVTRTSQLAGKRNILSDVNVEVSAGELLAVVGPNGAGKSTLLNVMSGLRKPDSGHIFVGQRRLSEMTLRERAQRIACVAQADTANIPLTVFETILLGRAPWQNMRGTVSDEDIALVQAAVECMELEKLTEVPLTHLSGGERQRTLIARALCQHTRLMILDEPTSALDYRHQLMLMEHLAALCRTGVSVVMVVHDIALAARYASSVFLLYEGSCLAQGEPAQVLTEDNLEILYQCHLAVDEDPWTHSLRITPLSC